MVKSNELTFRQRIVAATIYVALLFAALYYLAGGFGPLFDSSTAFSKILLSGGLLLIFGAYIAEPFFTKPTDVLVNATGITLFLLGIDKSDHFIGRELLLGVGMVLIGISVVVILLGQFPRFQKVKDGFTRILVLIGQSRVAYSAIYLATLFTYFQNNKIQFTILLTFWAVFISGFVVELLVVYFSKTIDFLRKDTQHVGKLIGHENSFVLKLEADKSCIGTSIGDLVQIVISGRTHIGVIVQKNALMNREWLLMYLLTAMEKTNSSLAIGSESYATKTNIEALNPTLKSVVERHEMFQNRHRIAGYVTADSNIHRIKFRVFANANGGKISEGMIVSTPIKDTAVLYQVLDGVTRDEQLALSDKDTYITGVAKKLGVYDKEKKEIISEKWLPEAYSPVYLLDDKREPVADKDIGELPGTDFALRIVNYDALVTHNTAILGILGVGKSCLTLELIQKVVANTGVKVIVLDITGQYQDAGEGLPKYVNPDLLDNSLVPMLNEKLKEVTFEAQDAREDGGNIPVLRELLSERLGAFMESDKRVLIVNPEEIIAIQQAEHAKNRQKNGQWEMYAPFSELSVAETTRIISETALTICKKEGMQKEAKLLLVFEEAHSLIPEWNSAANDNDKAASNGTARVILQGRKYGLGSFVITQRTANISKSILNQCNTIFALRVFDDTGKQFLENYIGSDFSNILPTLEDRHAILVGKALRLKQPVIACLNDRELVMLKPDGAEKDKDGGGIVLVGDESQ